MPKQGNQVFHCQYEGCVYSHESKKHFKAHRYLKQHYDKVHAEKKFSCPLCSKGFSTTTLLKSHQNYCGREFKCSCGVVYKSNEALLTHAKRKKHLPGSSSRSRKAKKLPNLCPTLIKIQLPLIIIPTNSFVLNNHQSLMNDNRQNNPHCSSQIMAAVALSELASGRDSNEKKEVSTQTESSSNNPDLWLNFTQEEVGVDLKERINSLGTQTETADAIMTLNPAADSPQSPSSPWLGSSAETQTVDEDAILRPFNLCNMHTQTPWNEINDEQDSTELTHTETQTLLSSFFIDSLPECGANSKELFIKQTSEDAGTDPMEIFSQ